jgi:hypothetical protein
MARKRKKASKAGKTSSRGKSRKGGMNPGLAAYMARKRAEKAKGTAPKTRKAKRRSSVTTLSRQGPDTSIRLRQFCSGRGLTSVEYADCLLHPENYPKGRQGIKQPTITATRSLY